MDMSQYRSLFLAESRENLGSLNELIIGLEQNAADNEKINALFRVAHSIKGMAASMGYGEITELSHSMEDLMDHVRKGRLAFGPDIADLLLEGADLLEQLLKDVESDVAGGRDIGALTRKLAAYPAGNENAESTAPAVQAVPLASTPAPVPEKLPDSRPQAGRAADSQTVRVKTQLLDTLINTTGELITSKHRLLNLCNELQSVRLDEAVRDVSRLIGDLHDSVIRARMVPFASLADRLPRIVRDTARKSGKDAEFRVEGKEMELDRAILDALYEPMVHVLRNAVDHGLEDEEQRIARGKEPKGVISVAVSREKDMVRIVISDDGRGMDPGLLIAAAVSRGVISEEQGKSMSDGQAFLLTCLPGFSTAREVTETSGRGVGMDAVQSSIHALGGVLEIESKVGQGSRIIFMLPLTVAIINVLLVSAGNLTAALPVTRVVRSVEVERSQIVSRGRMSFVQIDGEMLPLLSLSRICGIPATSSPGRYVPAAIVRMKGRMVGLAVDRFIGQREVFVKNLGGPLGSRKGIAGGAILGDGEVVFILDVPNLF